MICRYDPKNPDQLCQPAWEACSVGEVRSNPKGMKRYVASSSSSSYAPPSRRYPQRYNPASGSDAYDPSGAPGEEGGIPWGPVMVAVGVGLGAVLLTVALWPSQAQAATRPTTPGTTPLTPIPTTTVRQESTSGGGGGGSTDAAHPSRSSVSLSNLRHYNCIIRGLDTTNGAYRGWASPSDTGVSVAETTAIRSFQSSYNTENAARGDATSALRQRSPSARPFSPSRVDVDGVLGPNTQRALDNYAQFCNQ